MAERSIPALPLVLACGVASAAADWSDTDALCAHAGGWEAVDVVGLRTPEHREIVADGYGSVHLPTRGAVGPVDHADYVLRVVADTERRHAGVDGAARASDALVGGSVCEGIVRQFSDGRLVDLDVTSSVDLGTDYPAGASLKSLFHVSVELSLKDGTVPASVFDPRNVQTLAQYIDRDPGQPLVVNLRLAAAPTAGSVHVFDVVMFTADGNVHGARSGPVVFASAGR